MKKCSKCGQTLTKCYIDWNNLKLFVKKSPPKIFAKNIELEPFVCSNCGYTEWYANNPEKLDG